jgi:hypothetical protein
MTCTFEGQKVMSNTTTVAVLLLPGLNRIVVSVKTWGTSGPYLGTTYVLAGKCMHIL